MCSASLQPIQHDFAVAGIDDRVRYSRIPPHVRLIISSEEKTLFDREIAADDEAISIDLDLRGVQRLIILVDFGENGDVADHLNLCDARITK